jgi:hypothetical protein
METSEGKKQNKILHTTGAAGSKEDLRGENGTLRNKMEQFWRLR